MNAIEFLANIVEVNAEKIRFISTIIFGYFLLRFSKIFIGKTAMKFERKAYKQVNRKNNLDIVEDCYCNFYIICKICESS